MHTDTGVGTHTCMCTGMCINMCIDKSTGQSIDTCMDKCIDTFIDICASLYSVTECSPCSHCTLQLYRHCAVTVPCGCTGTVQSCTLRLYRHCAVTVQCSQCAAQSLYMSHGTVQAVRTHGCVPKHRLLADGPNKQQSFMYSAWPSAGLEVPVDMAADSLDGTMHSTTCTLTAQ